MGRHGALRLPTVLLILLSACGPYIPFPAALVELHEKAIYLHEARQYQVEKFDYEQRKAFVRRVECDYFTDAIDYTQVKELERFGEAPMVDALVRALPFVELDGAAFFAGFLLVLTTNRDRFSSKTALAVGIPLRAAQTRVRECTKRLQICHKNLRKILIPV